MIISSKNNITIIKQEKDSINELAQELSKSVEKFSSDNIIINLITQNEVKPSDVLDFFEFSNNHRESQHSLVIVNNSIDLDEIADELVVVPTLQEAFDIIEMEEMERDLGF